jgi:hypothetical protein
VCRPPPPPRAPRIAAPSGPALTIEERIEERLAFKLDFYRVRPRPPVL